MTARQVLAGVAGVAGFAAIWAGVSAVPTPPADAGRLPVCEQEDGSSGVLPCRWDGGPNGTGVHYTITSDGVVNYTGN